MKSRSFERSIVLYILFFVTLGIGVTLLHVQMVQAATCTVANGADSGSGSLRDLLGDSACSTINFNGDATITLDSTLTIARNVTIDGTGHTVTISGQDLYRVFIINTGVNASLKSLTITEGVAPTTTDDTSTNGGGIYNNGTLTVTNSTILENVASNFGAGIFNNGNLTVSDSTFYRNTGEDSGGWGGAIWNQGTMTITDTTFDSNTTPSGDGAGINNRGKMTVIGSTFTDNLAGYYGGAIYNGEFISSGDASTIIANSTFTGNSAGYYGGGVYNHHYRTLTLLNDTFSGNSAWEGANLDNDDHSTLNFANTILADPVSSGDCYSDSSNGATIGTNTHNWVSDGSCGTTSSGDPKLGSLSDNGGPTQTLALLAGSPAIDVGDAAICTTSPVNDKDQRGVTRPQGSGCDIGAYEYGPIIPLVTVSTPATGAAVVNLKTFTVTFNQDMLHNGSAKAANDTANYLLVERGQNGAFDTLSCKGGIQGDDKRVPVNNATYNSSQKTATLTLSNFLPGGSYRLFVCGTTSIWSAAGLELNNGTSDTQIDFTADQSMMPATGFAPGRISVLGDQAVSYAALGNLWLEIPRLGVQEPIMGVPQSADGSWDVSWLGDDVGWLNGTAYPTWAGNSVLTGHVYDDNGQPGPFQLIDTLKWGDRVIVHIGSVQYIYEIREVVQVSPSDTAAMLKHEDLPWITLVTCRGYSGTGDDYDYRVLIRAALIDVKPAGSQ